METSILNMLQEEIELYGALKREAEEQGRCIVEDDVKGFADASERRERHQSRISSLDERIRRSLRALPQRDMLTRIDEMRGAIENLAREILDLDQRNTERAREKRDEAARVLETLKRGRRGVRGYGSGSSQRAPRFIDRKG